MSLTLEALRAAWADTDSASVTEAGPASSSSAADVTAVTAAAAARVTAAAVARARECSSASVRARTVQKRRYFRVFISSTFMDMEADREFINTLILPALERRCQARNIGLSSVDLQWGVPGGTPNDEVLRTCFRELRACSTGGMAGGEPLFLWLGGARFGWAPAPQDVPSDVRTETRWCDGASVTAMEVIVGGLRGPNPNAFCYLRSDSYIESALVAPFRFTSRGEDCFRTPAVAHCQRALRAAIAERMPREQVIYYDPSADASSAVAAAGASEDAPLAGWPAFAADVEARLWARIDALTAATAADNYASWRENEAVTHDAVVAALCASSTPRAALVTRVVEAVDAGGAVVVLAPSGAGKSTVVAEAVAELSERGFTVAAHFVGAAARSESLTTLGRRVAAEADLAAGGAEIAVADLPGDDAAACARAREALCGTSTPSKLVLVVDAVNQIAARDAAARLAWLPPPGSLAPGVRLLVSVAEDAGGGADAAALLARLPGATVVRAGPLASHERVAVCNGLLASFHKRLSPEHTALVCANDGAASPTWLRLALRALRLHATYETLGARIADLPLCVEGLVNAELAAVEARLGRAPTAALALLLTVARSGVAEREAAFAVPLLVAALDSEFSSAPGGVDGIAALPVSPSSGGGGGGGGSLSPRALSDDLRVPMPSDANAPLPPLHLAHLTGALSFLLRDDDGGTMELAHGLLREAIERRYGERAITIARRASVSIFSRRTFAAAVLPARRALELPFQLAALGDGPALARALAQPWALMWLGAGGGGGGAGGGRGGGGGGGLGVAGIRAGRSWHWRCAALRACTLCIACTVGNGQRRSGKRRRK